MERTQNPSEVSEVSFDDLIAAACTDRTSTGIAASIGALVRHRELQPGDRLPTVRALARRLEVSSNTISDAWRILNHHGVIATARRNGTVIRAARAEMSGRFWNVPATAGSGVLDLSTGTPDTGLLPSLTATIGSLGEDLAITSYIDRPVLVELEAKLRSRWPFVPEAMTVVDGALDALDRLISALVTFGDIVIVEDPTFPPILDMLERAGAEILGVELDGEGIRPDLLEIALESLPAMALLQPQAHNPTGRSMSPTRLREVAGLFAAKTPDTWVLEDHHAGDLLDGPPTSLGQYLPGQVVRIHSFSKSHGPDLRIAAIGGASEPIAAVIDRRRLGPSWTSRFVQHMLLTLLDDPATDDVIARAATEYSRRRQQIVVGLAPHGIDVRSTDGLNLWIPVANEQRALVALALDGIGVAPGAPFSVETGVPVDHLRVSVGNARGDLERVIASIAAAARA